MHCSKEKREKERDLFLDFSKTHYLKKKVLKITCFFFFFLINKRLYTHQLLFNDGTNIIIKTQIIRERFKKQTQNQ